MKQLVTPRKQKNSANDLAAIYRSVKPIVNQVAKELESQNYGVKLSVSKPGYAYNSYTANVKITFTYSRRAHIPLLDNRSSSFESLIKFLKFPLYKLETKRQEATISDREDRFVHIFDYTETEFPTIVELKKFLSAYLRRVAFYYNNHDLVYGLSQPYEIFGKLKIEEQRKRLLEFYSKNDDLIFNINHVYANPNIKHYDSKIKKLLQARHVDIQKAGPLMIKKIQEYQKLIPMLGYKEVLNFVNEEFHSNGVQQLLL